MSRKSSVLKSPRTIVLCFDGTAEEYNACNTNVVKFFSLLKKDDFQEQVCYYQAGIGTFFAPGIVSPLLHWVAKTVDLGIAWYLSAHVMNGYRFLMQNYRVGDKICLFGYSRGAYTARALAGMLHKVGLLSKDNEEQIYFAYKLYKQNDSDGIELSEGFKQTFCQTVTIEFLGVFDTVASVGVLAGPSLPFTNNNDAIKTFRHALSLDERRVRFLPNVYQRTVPKGLSRPKSYLPKRMATALESKGFRNTTTAHAPTSKPQEPPPSPEDVLEVWFAGAHTDIGGGALPNDADQSLANLPLRWMVQQVIKSQCGIMFDQTQLNRVLDCRSLIIPLSPPPTDNDSPKDALEAIHDKTTTFPLWWILEVLPHRSFWQDRRDNNVWHSSVGVNLGRGRKIRDPQPHFHTSVKARIETLGYKPKARWETGTEVYVD